MRGRDLFGARRIVRAYWWKPRRPPAGAGDGNPKLGQLGGYRKRAVDVAIAGTALVLLAPIMLAAILLIRLLIGKPVFVAESLIGFRGQVFACFRLRTALYGYGSPSVAAQTWPGWWHHRWVESLAQALRSSRLDKIPLFYSVLVGDMSLVGPRPLKAHEVQWHLVSAPEVFMARPGLTGMWRHVGAKDRTYARYVALDRYYVHHWSMGLDCALLIKAVAAHSRATGAA